MRPTTWLFIFAALIMLGSVMPWVETVAGTLSGYQGAGLWTLAGGGLVFAGALLHTLWRRQWLTVTHAVIGGVIALSLAAWQGWRLVQLCPGGACAPGPGLVLVAIGGLGALLVAGRVAGLGQAPDRVAG